MYAKIIIASIPSIAGGATIPFLVSHIVDSITSGEVDNLPSYILYFAGLLLITKLGDLIFNYHFNTADRIVAANERKKLAEKFLFSKSNLSPLYTEDKILNRMINEVYSKGTLYSIAPVMLIINIVMALTAFCVLVVLNFKLLILASCVIPLVYVCGTLLKKNISRASQEETIAYEKVLSKATEFIRGFTDIKSLKAESQILKSLAILIALF